MTVYFYNAEPIDINSIAIMGVSVKQSENPIGFFGTGLKFAIATLLRNGCKVTLTRSGEAIKFSVATETIRGEEFDRVVMGDERLGFTTKLGRTWEPWQAYRELYCNCIDEGGTIDTLAPKGDYGTVFAVEGEAIENCHRSRDEIFLGTMPFAKSDKIEIHHGRRLDTFYRGVRAHRHQSSPLFTYNVIGNLALTEDRTIKEPFYIGYYAAQLIPTIDDASVIEEVITAKRGTFEAAIDFSNCYAQPSKAFMDVCRAHRHDAHASMSAMKLWEKHADNQLTFDTAGSAAVRVRKLEWSEPTCGPDEYRTIAGAHPCNFRYEIARDGNSRKPFTLSRSCDINAFAWAASIEEAKSAAQAHFEAAIRSTLEPGQSPIELSGVREAIAEKGGIWRSCTGCHETNEGVPTGPWSSIFQCNLGGGCSECGGIGAVWDTTDYADMARFIHEDDAPPSDRDAEVERLREDLRLKAADMHSATSGDRNTHTDGFVDGLLYAVRRIDDMLDDALRSEKGA